MGVSNFIIFSLDFVAWVYGQGEDVTLTPQSVCEVKYENKTNITGTATADNCQTICKEAKTVYLGDYKMSYNETLSTVNMPVGSDCGKDMVCESNGVGNTTKCIRTEVVDRCKEKLKATSVKSIISLGTNFSFDCEVTCKGENKTEIIPDTEERRCLWGSCKEGACKMSFG